MEDIRSVLSQFKTKSKNKSESVSGKSPIERPSLSEIPDVFFDIVLKDFKLSRTEISILMLLYRQIWCRPNLHRIHGIGPINSYAKMSEGLGISHDQLSSDLRNLESIGLIETIRSGQYFVRKYFTESLDQRFHHSYEEFF